MSRNGRQILAVAVVLASVLFPSSCATNPRSKGEPTSSRAAQRSTCLDTLHTADTISTVVKLTVTPQDEKATIKPGPNNPVGVIWIALNLEHYGLHGTPEPGNIARTESHGCVRLTNWDALALATMVRKGTPVVFLD